MDLTEAIRARRSIRRFYAKEIPASILEQVLAAAVCAPSAKNRQPWRFVVLTQAAKARMLQAMERGLQREREGTHSLLPNSAHLIAGVEYSLRILQEAPAVILVLAARPKDFDQMTREEQRFYEMADLQSVGAAIQNLLLAATDQGLGSLWVCDLYFAEPELLAWLNTGDILVAAVALGYPAESPAQRPRKKLDAVAVWLQD